MPTLACPGDVAPGSWGESARAPAARTTSTTGSMSSRRIPSVNCRISSPTPAPTASRMASGAAECRGRRLQEVLAPVCRTASADRVRRPGPGLSRRREAALAGRSPPPRCGCRTPASGGKWNSPSRPVMPWTTRRVSRPIRDAHATPPVVPRAAANCLRSRLVQRRRPSRRPPPAAAAPPPRRSLPTIPDDHRHVALLAGPGVDSGPRATSSPRVDPAERC